MNCEWQQHLDALRSISDVIHKSKFIITKFALSPSLSLARAFLR